VKKGNFHESIIEYHPCRFFGTELRIENTTDLKDIFLDYCDKIGEVQSQSFTRTALTNADRLFHMYKQIQHFKPTPSPLDTQITTRAPKRKRIAPSFLEQTQPTSDPRQIARNIPNFQERRAYIVRNRSRRQSLMKDFQRDLQHYLFSINK